ncbi:MAG: hypothetical protein EA388_09345 [Nitriliruptor sp.]|nr:MAG: hypothetical protein EA388_09345 [Nitriliruptor sp.]
MPAEPGTDTAGSPASEPDTDVVTTGSSGPQRSVADRIARQVLLIEGADPKAVFEIKGALWISAIRCVLTYALIPLLAPIISWAGVVATPIALALSVLAVLLAVNSLRRVWLADYRYRWPYTAFILVVLGLLAFVIVVDVRALLT